MKKLVVNQDTCIGCGACIQIAEEHFDFSPTGTGTSVAINQENLENEKVAMAIDTCPVGAISIVEDENACHCHEKNEDGKCHCHDDGNECHCHDDNTNCSCEGNCNN